MELLRGARQGREVVYPAAEITAGQTECQETVAQEVVPPEEYQEDDGGAGAAVCVAGGARGL